MHLCTIVPPQDATQWEQLLITKRPLVELLMAFAPEFITPFLQRFKRMDPTWDCLQNLLLCIIRKEWDPCKLPLALAAIYLRYPHAHLEWCCSRCRLMIPILRGQWSNSTTEQVVQAPRHFFRECPACFGELHNRFDHQPIKAHLSVPWSPSPPWEFAEEHPAELDSATAEIIRKYTSFVPS